MARAYVRNRNTQVPAPNPYPVVAGALAANSVNPQSSMTYPGDPEVENIASEVPACTADQMDMLRRIQIHRDTGIDWGNDQKRHPVELYRRYVEGDHDITLTERQKLYLEGLLGNKFSDNVCQQIVEQAASRLKLMRWDAADKVDWQDQSKQIDAQASQNSMNGNPPDPVELMQAKQAAKQQASKAAETTVHKFLEDLFANQQLARKSTQVHYDLCRDGNTYVSLGMVQPDPAKDVYEVRVYREDCWDGNTGLWVRYDADDSEKMLYAVKEWVVHLDSGRFIRRRTVWLPGELQRWVSYSGGMGAQDWVPYMLEQDNGVWPLPWRNIKTATDLPIPVVHMPNSGRTTSVMGNSELAGGIIGGQDQLTDLQLIMCGASRKTGYQMYYATGVRNQIDPITKEETPPEIVADAGEVWTSTSKDTSFGVLPAGDMTNIIAAYTHKIGRIAAATATPMHTITGGNWPSGEALLRAEQPAVGKAERQIATLLDRWALVGKLAVQLQNAFGTGPVLDEGVRVESVIDDPRRNDILAKAAVAQVLSPFISNQEALRICDYSEDRIQSIMDEKAQSAASSIDTAMSVFNAGVAPGQGAPGAPGAGQPPKPGAPPTPGGAPPTTPPKPLLSNSTGKQTVTGGK